MKLRYKYHDAHIRSVEYRETDITLTIHLCGHCSGQRGGVTHLYVYGVRNLDEAKASLETALTAARTNKFYTELLDITIERPNTLVFYPAAGSPIRIEASAIQET